MKRLISVNKNSNATDIGLLIARLVIAALMLTHGIPKMQMLFSGEPIKFLPVMGMSAELSLALTVFAEVFCSIFLLAGFATRLVTIPLIITMLVAVLIVHGADPIAIKEPALHYLLVYVILVLMGSGKYSVDYLLQTKAVGVARVNDKEHSLVLNKYPNSK
jgi:putative oxidoreductase